LTVLLEYLWVNTLYHRWWKCQNLKVRITGIEDLCSGLSYKQLETQQGTNIHKNSTHKNSTYKNHNTTQNSIQQFGNISRCWKPCIKNPARTGGCYLSCLFQDYMDRSFSIWKMSHKMVQTTNFNCYKMPDRKFATKDHVF